MNAVVRPARAEDVDALLTLFTEVAAERRWIGTEPGFDRAAYRSGWSEKIEREVGAVLVAERDGIIVGNLSVAPAGPLGWEIGLLVAREERGKGIGSALMRAAIDWAEEHGITVLSLLVFPHNTPAIALYERFGFVETKRYHAFKKRQSGERWDAIVMTRCAQPDEPAT